MALGEQTEIKERNVTMTFELYDALKSIGVDTERAKKAAEALDLSIDQKIVLQLAQSSEAIPFEQAKLFKNDLY
ncbi:MAG: hypothetical protein CTY12_06580 [Methylotenera sp.]|nr:MAG: hypothetical protein CTY12_06580 [Methylotenera sp.]